MNSFLSLGAFFLMIACASPDTLSAESIKIALHKGRTIKLPKNVESIAVGNADIADTQKIDVDHLYILGNRIGNTNVIICVPKDCSRTINVEVTHDLEGLREKLHEIFPEEHPKIHSSQGSIVISGQISSLEKINGILSIAATFVPHDGNTSNVSTTQATATTNPIIPGTPLLRNNPVSSVVNLMQLGGPQQIMLGVTVAEIARTLSRTLKVDFNAYGGGSDVTGGAIGAGAMIQALKMASATVNPATLFFSFVGRDATVQTVINAAKTNGLAKILAEPNLTTISGQDAEFVSGGEFPIPVPQFGAQSGTGGGITVVFKEYGVILKFLPVVLDSGRISLKINIAVSEIQDINSLVIPTNTNDKYFIPSIRKRNAASAMELDDGQTLGIAGLISDNMHETISKFPGLGDLPLLGQLFTSQSFQKDETELMIFVTPHLVKPMDSAHMRLPTDAVGEPNDVEFYLMGRTESEAPPKRPGAGDGTRYGGGLRGHFGQGM